MNNNALFEIPVYTCTQDEFVERVTSNVDSYMANIAGHGTREWQEIRDQAIQSDLKPVRHNELVGCIDIYRVGSKLCADYWFTKKQRIAIGSKTKADIQWCGKLLEKRYRSSTISSQELFADFRSALISEIRRHSRLKNRFVDMEAFDRCGPFVDWRSVLEL